MAEETVDNTDDTLARVEQYVQGLVTQYLKEAQPQPTVPQQQTTQPTYEEQLKQYVNPVIDSNPMVRQAHFKAFDVDDKVDFYADPENYLYKDQVEAGFKQLADAGRPTSRKDIKNWIIGSEYAKDPVAFNAKQSELKKAQLDRARAAGDFASGGVGRDSKGDTFPSIEEFSKLTSDEQGKLLEGMTF